MGAEFGSQDSRVEATALVQVSDGGGGRAFQAEGTCSAKALRQGHAWCVGGTVMRPMWREQSEGEGRRRGAGWEETGQDWVGMVWVFPLGWMGCGGFSKSKSSEGLGKTGCTVSGSSS